MKHIHPSVAVALLATLPTALWAQTTSPTAAAGGQRDDEIVEISPFVVAAGTGTGNEITESTSGSLVSRPLQLTPMSIQVVSSDYIREMGGLNGDALALVVPGLSNQTNTSSNGDGNNTTYTLRGFQSIPRLNGFAPGGRIYDFTSIDRVEVIKGPNSLLYGQSDPGGIINYISKRPQIHTNTGVTGRVTATGGDYDFLRGETDINATVIPGKLAFRLPASDTTAGREFDGFRVRTLDFGPSVLYRLTPNTEIYAIYEWYDQKVNNFAAFQPIVFTPPGGTEFVSMDRRGLGRDSNFPFGQYSHNRNYQTNWMADLTTRPNEHITGRFSFSKNTRNRDEVVPTGGDPFRVTPVPYSGLKTDDGNVIDGYKADLLGQWEVGKFQTRTIAGYEYNENDYFVTGYVTRSPLYTLNVGFDPATGLATRSPLASDYAPLDVNYFDPTVARISTGPARFRSKWKNMRISEVLSGFNDRLQLLGGVARGESILVNLINGSSQSQRANVYQIGVGLALDPDKHHMLFFNQSTSYVPQFLFDIDSNPLPPTTGFGDELGIKSTWGTTGLTTTVTVFDQSRKNVGRQFTDPILNRTYGVLTPGENARGAEGELWYHVTSNFELNATYTYFHGKITGAPVGRDYLIGRHLPRSPERSANLFANYRFNGPGWVKGLRLGGGVSYKCSTWLDTGQGQNTLNRISNDYAVVWVTAAKEFALPGRRAIVVRLNVGNLLDKEYITEANTYGAPRETRLAVDYKF